MQLERVVELAGMTGHCDFSTQVSMATPDPRSGPTSSSTSSATATVVDDAKVPLHAYLDALAATDPDQHDRHLADHA